MKGNPPPYILDASALLVLLLAEPGVDKVLKILDRSYIHTVNLAEALFKLNFEGLEFAQVAAAVDRLQIPLETEFSERQAFESGSMGPMARKYGLSLGDRICLTTARTRRSIAVTADRRWSGIPKLGVRLLQIR